MTYTKQTSHPYIEKRDGTQIFETTPDAVQAAWEAHRPYYVITQTRRLVKGEAEPYTVTLLALQRLVRRHARVTGYFRVDNGQYLVGYGGWSYDPKWLIIPDQGC